MGYPERSWAPSHMRQQKISGQQEAGLVGERNKMATSILRRRCRRRHQWVKHSPVGAASPMAPPSAPRTRRNRGPCRRGMAIPMELGRPKAKARIECRGGFRHNAGVSREGRADPRISSELFAQLNINWDLRRRPPEPSRSNATSTCFVQGDAHNRGTIAHGSSSLGFTVRFLKAFAVTRGWAIAPAEVSVVCSPCGGAM